MTLTPDASNVEVGSERRLTAEHATARALVEASSFADAAPKILQAICESLGWAHGALWMVDRTQQVLRCTEIWTVRGREFPEFHQSSKEMTFARGVGLPGRVWDTAQPVWIPDVARDTNFPRAQVAAREGLHASFGFPVIFNGEVLSVLEFFSVDIRPPDDKLLSMLAGIGNQIGLFYGRQHAQDELNRFFTLSLDMLCIAGFDGYFKRVNPAWERVLGYTTEELLSRPYVEFIHPEDRDASAQQALMVSSGVELFHFENRYLHKDGTLRWLVWTAAPYPELQVIYCAAHDITERKAAEQTLAEYAHDLEASHRALAEQTARLEQLVKELEAARRRAEEATETKSAFLANMSHEIRTPLNAVLGMTALALQTRLTAEQRDYLTTVKSSAESLLEIINDVLDFSKIEAKRLDLERIEFDAREVIGDACKMLALRAVEKGLELACHIAQDVPDTLLGDQGRLRQVLLNVVGNAIKFTDTGEVVLRVAVDNLAPRRVMLHFSVSDTGIGIPEDKQQHIFEAFTQADTSTTRRYGGTGLGLAIAQRLVSLMNGRMWVDSAVGRGSTFHFTAEFETRKASVRTAPKPSTLEGLRVLVVDDNATNRRILDEMLASWRMRPTTVADAASALAVLRRTAGTPKAFDVVISDCQMPEVDGFALAQRVKRDRELSATPFVMLTSIGDQRDVARAKKIGVDACLSKPVKHSDLLDALVTLFGVSTRTAAAAKRPKPRSRRLRVLVAEDNIVNRKLVTRLLQQRGHQIVAVENGRAAVEAVATASKPFDVVLMDVQMPEMNGLEATTAIREREMGGRSRLPIIALTAHAMQGDRERCLAAGMDAYLPKPIDVDELLTAIETHAETRMAPQPVASVPQSSDEAEAPVFNLDAALKHAGGDRRLLAEVVKLFREDYPRTLRSLTQAIQKNDAERVRMSAHALKGVLATVGSTAGRNAAFALEQLGRSGRLAGADEALATLRQVIAALEQQLDQERLLPARSRRPSPAKKRTVKRRTNAQDTRRRR